MKSFGGKYDSLILTQILASPTPTRMQLNTWYHRLIKETNNLIKNYSHFLILSRTLSNYIFKKKKTSDHNIIYMHLKKADNRPREDWI